MDMENNAQEVRTPRVPGPRHSILDLAPLELECLSALWPMGEGTVRDIYRALAATRARAYTTVMTIMDRLEQKGIVARRKVGRAYLYQATLSAEEARLKAVEKIVQGFFHGSTEALAAHLTSRGGAEAGTESGHRQPVPVDVDVRAAAVPELPNQNLDETLL